LRLIGGVFTFNDSNSNEKASCFSKDGPLGIAVGFGNGEAFYVDLENFEGGPGAASPIKTFLQRLSREISLRRKREFRFATRNRCSPDIGEGRYIGRRISVGIHPVKLPDTVPRPDLCRSRRSSKVPHGFEDDAFRTAESADFIARLAPILRKKIHEAQLDQVYLEIELPLIPVLADIELAGMKVDGENLKKFSEFISKELDTLQANIFKIAGREFNIGSPKQVGEIFGELNIETGRKTATGQISTSHDVLIELAETYDIAKFIIDYRELDKLRATYADALPKMIGSDGVSMDV
jgi:hypothetical protein